jgi:hypothetical protein
MTAKASAMTLEREWVAERATTRAVETAVAWGRT